MKTIKCIAILTLLAYCCFPAAAEKRQKRKSMKELSDPNSLSYVPIPYPKTRSEIITDLHYYIKQFRSKENSWSTGKPPLDGDILRNLLSKKNKYKIGKISKAITRSPSHPDDYYWLIPIVEGDDKVIITMAFRASGLFAVSGSCLGVDMKRVSPEYRKMYERFQKLHPDKEIKQKLMETLGSSIEAGNIQKIERISYLHSNISELLAPLRRIHMSSGVTYFYSIMTDSFYTIERTKNWKRDKNGIRPIDHEAQKHGSCLRDPLADRVIFLKKVTKRK
ncbi:MAG: hypothetical protein GY765_43685 [bacterium]|nr:hypothetical protein [bacterium]